MSFHVGGSSPAKGIAGASEAVAAAIGRVPAGRGQPRMPSTLGGMSAGQLAAKLSRAVTAKQSHKIAELLRIFPTPLVARDPSAVLVAVGTTVSASQTPVDLPPHALLQADRGSRDFVGRLGDSDGWAGLASHVCEAASLWAGGDTAGAVKVQLAALQDAVDVTKAADTNWTVDVLHTVAHDAFAMVAACYRGAGGFAAETRAARLKVLEDLAQSLRVAFSATAAARSAITDVSLSKKLGALGLAVLMFRVYFLLGNARACATVVSGTEGPVSLPLTSFPRHQLAPYHFFRGRFALFEGDLGTARSNFERSLKLTPRTPRFRNNTRLILAALVPVWLHFGVVVRGEVLKRYRLEQYLPIVHAYRRGHVGEFEAAIDRNRVWFLRHGVYIALERLGLIVQRTLVKRAIAATESGHLVPIDVVRAALKVVGLDSSTDLAECTLATLVFRGLLKGYLSHSFQKLVTAKSDAFPLSALNGRH
jgi:hypothetical protein